MTSPRTDPNPPEPLRLDPDLAERVRRARSLVVFTGAGVSQESGLATFRGTPGDGPPGLWQTFRPEELATPEAFERRPDTVWSWYAERHRQAQSAQPNPAHHAIERLERFFPSFLLVTQNVDGLHHRAGSRRVVEVHGTLRTARCHRCGEEEEMNASVEKSPTAPPVCGCGGKYRPGVVWFGEALPEDALETAWEAARSCDLLLSAGTSAQVYPAAGILEIGARAGAALIEVNPEPTPFSGVAALTLREPAGRALPALAEAVARCRRPQEESEEDEEGAP